MSGIAEYIAEKREEINTCLNAALPETDIAEKRVVDAMRYSLLCGGKRLRPILTLMCCEALGGGEDAMAVAVAVEMIHTHSLIHDDLPAMDNDSLRRGYPTCHIKFDEATAILAGDALIHQAFTHILKSGMDDGRKVKAAGALAGAAGHLGMVGGQMLDIQNEGKRMETDALLKLNALKTGELIRAACALGAIAAGKGESTFDEYALNLGAAFQINDDILDIEGSREKTGKNTGSDRSGGKNTLAGLLGMKEARRLCGEYTERAVRSVGFLGQKAERLILLAEYLQDRER
jgi:geranylgeranyl pyrophosphate synthase